MEAMVRVMAKSHTDQHDVGIVICGKAGVDPVSVGMSGLQISEAVALLRELADRIEKFEPVPDQHLHVTTAEIRLQ